MIPPVNVQTCGDWGEGLHAQPIGHWLARLFCKLRLLHGRSRPALQPMVHAAIPANMSGPWVGWGGKGKGGAKGRKVC
jgi:hypothetical protein